MAVTPQNTTGTLFVDYAWNGGEHSIQFHHALSSNLAAITDMARNFLQALQPEMGPSWTVRGLRYRAAGSTVSLPAGTLTIAGTDVTDPPDLKDPRFVSFVGRSNTGKRSRVSVYGLNIIEEADYRIENADNAALDAARAVLNVSSGVVSAVDGSQVSWYPYYNWGFNAYVQRRQRRTG